MLCVITTKRLLLYVDELDKGKKSTKWTDPTKGQDPNPRCGRTQQKSKT